MRQILDALLGRLGKVDKQILPLKYQPVASVGEGHGSFYPEIAVETVEGPLNQESMHLKGPGYMDNDLQLGSAVMAKAARRIAETVVG